MDLNIDILNQLVLQSSNAAMLQREIQQILKGLPASSLDSLAGMPGCQTKSTSKGKLEVAKDHEYFETGLGSSPPESGFQQDTEICIAKETITPSDPAEVPLKSDELGFYRALTFNFEPDSGLEVERMARELSQTIRENAMLDWAVREAGRAKLRILAKRVLRKHRYPDEKCEETVSRILDCAAAFEVEQVNPS